MPRGEPTKVLAVRIPQVHYASLKSEARRHRMRLSDYLRRLLGAEADRLLSAREIAANSGSPEAQAATAPPTATIASPVASNVRNPIPPVTTHRTFAAPAGVPSRNWVPIGRKVGRNDICPCGSGLKYNKCHGRIPD